MSLQENFLTPVGRLVSGSLYVPRTKGQDGNLIINKKGEPSPKYEFGFAILKGSESHWSQTEWGKIVWEFGHKNFPNQAGLETFSWKIKDGDSTTTNAHQVRYCDRDGIAGNWVIYFSSKFAPQIFNSRGSELILQTNFVNPGDYIQVFGTIKPNTSSAKPGIYMNHTKMAFVGYGKPITVGVDASAIGFGQAPLPAGVSATPIGVNMPTPAPVAASPVPATVEPYTPILNPTPPPPPAAPVQRVMTALANGATYEQFIANKWTDEMLIQHGYMSP